MQKYSEDEAEYNHVIFLLRGELPTKHESVLRDGANAHAKVEHRSQRARSGEVLFCARLESKHL